MCPIVPASSETQELGCEQVLEKEGLITANKLAPHASQEEIKGVDYGSEVNTDAEEEPPQNVPHISERRRRQNEIFNTWMAKRAKEALDDHVNGLSREISEETSDELLSIRRLMARQENKRIISTPREYQLELFERAKNENIIAVLDTGSGKTLIAVMLLRHIIEEELENRLRKQPPRIAFFLVHSVALVFQQFAVLESNLDQPIERFCGEMNVDSFSKSTWVKHFKDNMAIVCTADILLHCLLKSFIQMKDINLLIFDEAHKTKKNHAYARIVKDFLIPESELTRPKIFGMTASPVDAKSEVNDAARDLETLLHSRIATTSDLALLRQTVSKPLESVYYYSPLPDSYKTKLCQDLYNRYKDIKIFQKLFRTTEIITSELGEWAADRLWKLALVEIEVEKLQRKTEQNFVSEGKGVTALNEELRLIKEAQCLVEEHPLAHPSKISRGISSKVLGLEQLLQNIFPALNDSRCLVFVKTRYTAQILADLVPRLGSQFMRIGYLIGARSGGTADTKVSVRQQLLTISRFRKGELNVLFATSIAEEGLDIPDCNAVIRFDLHETLIQYIQSRGRARHVKSRFISMLEQNNAAHSQTILESTLHEGLMRRFCMTLPENRLLEGNENDLEDLLDDEKNLPHYIVPETGAKLTFSSALGTIEHFIACLRRDDETTSRLTYYMKPEGQNFSCEVVLPSNSPIVSVIGKPFPRKALAKRSAAFQACLDLLAEGHLDKHLIPIYHKELPKMRNAQLAISSKKAKEYPMLIKPAVWKQSIGVIPLILYMTIIYLDNPEALGRPSAPLALLTRTPLIHFPSFPIYPQPGFLANVQFTLIKEPLKLTENSLDLLSSFTFRIYKDLFHKVFQHEQSQLSYWFAPILSTYGSSQDQDPFASIDWETLNYVEKNDDIKWVSSMTNKELENLFLIDPWDGSRHLFTMKVDPSRTPHDPVPQGSPRPTGRQRQARNILEYSLRKHGQKQEEEIAKVDVPQPVIEAHQVSLRYDWLHDWSDQEANKQTKCYVCPLPLRISAIPQPFAVTGYMLPSVLHRLEAYLIAYELCCRLGLDIKLELALEAITKDSDNTEEHDQKKVNFQRGMGNNYERLEFLGDSFLKMATSIALYAKNATDDEFHCHVKRMLMVCNRNLFNTAMELNLFKYIRSKGFNRRTWYQGNLTLVEGKGAQSKKDLNRTAEISEKASETATASAKTEIRNLAIRTRSKSKKEQAEAETFKHRLSDKSVADVCEALIGASLLSAPPGDFDMAVRSVTRVVNNSISAEEFGESDHHADKFIDYSKSYTVPEWQKLPASASQKNLVEQCAQEDSGYRFKWPRLLRAAFTHPSTPFSWENIPSYQRLEFLGDALFDMVTVSYIFEKYPDKDPQWLTEHKMAIVSNKFLGAICVRLGFQKHMRNLSSMLLAQITEYVNDIREQEEISHGARDYWTNAQDPPKCLPDIVEAYVGALFIDSDFSYGQVQRFFDDHIRWYFEDMTIYDSFANSHPTTALSNLLSMSLGCSNFRLLCQEIPTIDGQTTDTPRVMAVVMIHHEIIANSEGTSSRYAKIRASHKAVSKLEGMKRDDFKRRFNCDCGSHTSNLPIVMEGKLDGLAESAI